MKIGKKILSKDDKYLIAEIGHNHQGNLKKALQLVKLAKDSGADAVKFQKRNNKTLFTKDFYNKPYDNPNSFGRTYGQHREKLELNKKQFKEIFEYSQYLKIDCFVTPFDKESVDFMDDFDINIFKIASADLNNHDLVHYISLRKKTVILSTGGATIEQIKEAHDLIKSINKNLIILHCTAAYPARIEDMNLNVIKTLQSEFKNTPIGLSDHENGIDAALIAYMLGARVFEKHFTYDRAAKGTDHAFSLEPMGLSRLSRNLERIPKLLGSFKKRILDCEIEPIKKMSKSIYLKKGLKKKEIITINDIVFKSPGIGLQPNKINLIINKRINKDKPEGALVLLEDVN
jgi:N-acetylneuraminate synthase/sialic acid synthase